MKLWTKLLVPVLVLGLVSIASAKVKGEKKAAHAGLKGKVVSVSADGAVKVKHGHQKKGDVEEVTLQTNESTAVEIDGVKGKHVSDLRPGEQVVVTPATGMAKEIKATSPPVKGAAKPAKAAKKSKKAA